jgi:hypothetical protein
MLKAISTITNALGALNYKGTWNASSNTPTLADGTGAKGDYYVVSTAGTQTFGGIQLFFGTGDWIAYNGAVWQRVEGGSDGNFANVTLTSTDAGANEAPTLDLYRDSASPTAADTLAEIQFNGEDSAGNKQKYACIHGSILSPTSGSEQGQIHFETQTAGSSTEKMIIGTTNLVINEIGAVFNVRIEGDTDANLFYTDATNSRIGVGTVNPAEKLDVVQDANSFAGQRIRNNDVGAAAYAGLIINANGNSWGMRMGSGAANSNAFECVIDALGTPVIKSSLSSTGVLTLSNYGAGAATFSAAGVISSVSDETWKIKDGVPVDPDSMVQKLKPGYWYYNDEKKEIFGVERQLGFYAQNVNYAIGPEAAPEPETFTTKNDDGIETTVSKPWGYYDRSVLAVVVMSLQKALVAIETLEAKVAALEEKA